MKKLELSVYLVNLRKLNKEKTECGEWLDLTDSDEVENKIDVLIGDDEHEIHDFVTNLNIDIKESTNIKALLYLVEVIENSEYTLTVISNILDQYHTIEEAAEVIEYGEIAYLDEIDDVEDLGRSLAEYLELTEIGREYFDHHAYGHDAKLSGWHIHAGAAVCIF